MTPTLLPYPECLRPWLEAFIAVPAGTWKIFFLFWTVGFFSYFVILFLSGWLSHTSPTQLWSRWIRSLRWPLTNLVLLCTLYASLRLLSGFPPSFARFQDTAARIALLAIAVGTAIRISNLLVVYLHQRYFANQDSESRNLLWSASAITLVLRWVIILIGLLVLLENLGIRLLGLLTTLGFLGGAVAFAAQSTIANFIGYFELIAGRVFKIGDRISFHRFDGFVRQRGIFNITLESLHSEVITVPNKQLVNHEVRCLTDGAGRSILSIDLGFPYSLTRQKIEEAIRLLCDALAVALPESLPSASFTAFGESSQNLKITLRSRYTNGPEFTRDNTLAHLTIRSACDQAGLTFAFPTRTVELHQPLPH